MKKILFLLLLVSSGVFAQKVEHGMLIGSGLGFPMQDKSVISPENDYFDHQLKGNGMIGYRLRFMPENKSFFDVDLSLGFQGMQTKRSPYGLTGVGNNYTGNGNTMKEFVFPISITAGWNYRLSDKFYCGLGVAPTLYVQPRAVFDLGILAKVGYQVSKHCELALSYQYGCLNVLKDFNIDAGNKGRKGHLSDLMFSVYIPFSVK